MSQKKLSYEQFKLLDVKRKEHRSQYNNNVINLKLIPHKSNPDRKSNAKALSKPILGKRKSDKKWRNFDNATDAARILSEQEDKEFCKGGISETCRKKRKFYNGYEFQYKQQPDLDGEEWKVNTFLNVKCSNLGRVETTNGKKT